MANQVDNTKVLSETRLMSGRRTIKTSVSKITKDNVQEVLFKALETHNLIARCLMPDILAFYESEEDQREFAEWKERREGSKREAKTE